MKYTFPILTLCLGGAQRMLVEIVNGLVSRGHDVTVLMPQAGAVEYDVKARIVRVPDMYHIFEKDFPQSDIIVSNYYTLVYPAEAASRGGKGLHARISLCYEPTFTPENHLTFPSYNLTKNLLVISRWQQQIIELNHGIKAHIVPVGINSAFYNKGSRNNDTLTIGAVVRRAEGNVCWHRNQQYLLDELIKVKQMHPFVNIQLICPAEELATAPSLLNVTNLHSFSTSSPKTDEGLCDFYNQADIFVSASMYEAASLPGMEAAKCGAALVTIYAGGNTDFGRHGETCLMSFAYERRLAEDISRLIVNPTLRNTLADNGEKEAQQWTWDKSVDAFEEAIQQFLAK